MGFAPYYSAPAQALLISNPVQSANSSRNAPALSETPLPESQAAGKLTSANFASRGLSVGVTDGDNLRAVAIVSALISRNLVWNLERGATGFMGLSYSGFGVVVHKVKMAMKANC